MEQIIIELSQKIQDAYRSCSLKTVNAFNPYQFEKMLDVLVVEYSKKGIKKSLFNELVKSSLLDIGARYEKKIK